MWKSYQASSKTLKLDEMTSLGMAKQDAKQIDWYSVLGASPTDGLQELRQKYQKLVLLYHPDKQGLDVAAREADRHLQRFIEVDQAWKVLSNEETKREYDLQLRAQELKQDWPVDALVSLEDMDWDDGTRSYTYGCRCGGEFIIGKEEMEEEEAIVCCDTCSLSIEIKRTA
ncbi:dnaJ homolog subfamily C member 24 isoform X2 [Clupea harengus]|uniref:DnaJ homolog subfamily C member 24 isoform X2 n=1 Tax=Clupea harengus TaxID=7950 RepID=A0A6P8FBU5_CLUHA|nr:dnaJ homolog subfamily C member 24 isoform X2 [Clupea harengus]